MARFGVKEVANVTFYSLLTKEPELFLDSLKMSNLENASETVYATGGQGNARLVGWDFSRTATFTIQDALLNPKAIAIQTGNELKNEVSEIRKRERVVALSGNTGESVAEVSKEPINGVNGVYAYVTTDGYDHVEKVIPISVTGTEVIFDETDVPIGTELLVYYKFETLADKTEIITISSDKFAGYYEVVGDTYWRNVATGQDEKVQIYIPRAKISSAFTLTMQPDGDPSVFDFNLDVFKDTNSNDMVQLIRYQD